MKTNTHFWSCIAQVFLEWEMFQTKVVKSIQTYIFSQQRSLFKSCHLLDNVEKYLEPERPRI